MVMLMTCVFVGKDTGIAYLQNMAAADGGKWHAIVYNADHSIAPFSFFCILGKDSISRICFYMHQNEEYYEQKQKGASE